MDCEKFDRICLDFLYDELDELTHAGAKRHTEHCLRCRDIAARVRATREVGRVPEVDPPEGLEVRILVAERRARAELPLRQRFGRVLSVLASYAMRPQLAMGALLLLVIASSMILFRARPGEQMNVFVTERGIPESESETVTILPIRTRIKDVEGAPSARRTPSARPPEPARETTDATASESTAPEPADTADREFERALAAYRDRRFAEAQERFQAIAARGTEKAPSAALHAAQAARARSGCPLAAPLFEKTYQRFPDTQAGQEAAWQAAGCYRTLGDFERARQHYQALLDRPGYSDRAQAALASMGDAPR